MQNHIMSTDTPQTARSRFHPNNVTRSANRYLQSRNSGTWAAVLATVLLSAKNVLAKHAYGAGATATDLLGMRLYIAAALLMLVLIFREGTNAFRVRAGGWPLLLALGSIGIAGSMMTSFTSIEYIGASLSTTLTFVYPAFTILLLVPLTKRAPDRSALATMILTLLGLPLLTMSNSNEGLESALFDIRLGGTSGLGVSLALGSALLYAFFNAGSMLTRSRMTALQLSAIGTTIAAVVHIAINGLQWNSDPAVLEAAVLLGIFCGFVPFLANAYALQTVGATRVVIIGSLGPPLTAILSMLFLDETLTTFNAIGIAIVVGGITLLNVRRQQRVASSSAILPVVHSRDCPAITRS